MTWPPSASIRAAAAITSITMKGGTSLRPDAVSRRFARSLKVDSSIDFCYLTRHMPKTGHRAPDKPHSVVCKGISRLAAAANRQSMIRKSGNRFSEKIMFKQKDIERDHDSKKSHLALLIVPCSA